MRRIFIIANFILIIVLATLIYFFPRIWWLAVVFVPFIILGIYDVFQKEHTILRNFPVVGHLRYWLEGIGPEIHQYFIESDTDGKPISRYHRTYIYQHAKQEVMTHPFGTELDLYATGYEWMNHSIYPAPKPMTPPRVEIGGPECKQPYSASILNISAMSYGSLSKNAIEALNKGAKAGNFYHNTGEGGISPHHLHGGDVVYQVGTGYFGCRTDDGNFNPDSFREQAARPEVKMIELKLSQGAKPGHGGILPAAKNNEEIAEIRHIKPFTDVHSPPGHRTFNDAEGLLKFIVRLRELANGKPIGFKLCIGEKDEFREICQQMVKTGIKPDFITIDGAEGGTGAAPIDFSNYVGMPLEEAIIFARDCLDGYDLKKDIKLIASAKIFTAYDIFRVMCFGADLCNSARGMMLALGCIQALKCNTNQCPSGVATNKPELMSGLVVEKKWQRVKNYHHEVLEDFTELLSAAGISNTAELTRGKIHKRISNRQVKVFSEIYPHIKPGKFLRKQAAKN